eukprot:1159156-Pelagomonas_calceolata.AAC.7
MARHGYDRTLPSTSKTWQGMTWPYLARPYFFSTMQQAASSPVLARKKDMLRVKQCTPSLKKSMLCETKHRLSKS